MRGDFKKKQSISRSVSKLLPGRVRSVLTEPLNLYCLLQTSHQLTSSSCCLSVDEWLATLYRSTKSPSMPSPSTGRCVAMAARAWHMRTREGSQARCSWPSRNSTADWLRCGRPFSSLTREVRAVWEEKEDPVIGVAAAGGTRMTWFPATTYFQSRLSTFAAVLAAKHQEGLDPQDSVLLQLCNVWQRKEFEMSEH